MKRVFTLALAALLCLALTCPAFAAEGGFVPSITYKGTPELVPSQGGDDPIIGIVHRYDKTLPQGEPVPQENILSSIYGSCLLLTPVAEAETSEAIPDSAAELLLYVYGELSAGRMKLPYDKAEGYNGEPMVIRELLDASWLCGGTGDQHDHPTQVEPDGIVFDITFDLGVAPEDKLIIMTYHDDAWEPIVRTVNNGDGTVTATFEHLCPVAISVATGEAPVRDASASLLPWILGVLAVVAVAVVLVLKRRTAKK